MSIPNEMTGFSPCNKCQRHTGSVSYYVGGLRLCSSCYSQILAVRNQTNAPGAGEKGKEA